MAVPLSLSSFGKALDSFKAASGLSPREISEMEITTLSDLQRTLVTMQNSQQKSRTMRYLGRLQPFLDAMEQYGKVIDVFVNTSNLVAFIWGPMKFLLLTAFSVAEAFNVLLDGYATIGEHMPLLVQYRQLFEKNAYMRSALASIFEDILTFHLEAVKLFKQRTWKQLFHATQRTLTRRVEEITKSLSRHKSILEAQTTVIQYEEFQASLVLMRDEFARSRVAEKDQRRARVQDWLGNTIDSLVRHEHIRKDRYGNSGQWLINHTRFQDWFAPDRCGDPLLWLHGMPGAGKTVLASRVIDEIRQLNGVIGVHFYCKDIDDPRTGQALLMRSMISQILSMNDWILDYLHREMSDSRETTLVSIDLIKRLLKVSIQSCKKVYIVIDGLDEYPRDIRKDIASWFQKLVHDVPRNEHGTLRCLFVSQDDGPGRKDLSMLAQIKVTALENGSDIESFCADWHKKIETKFGLLQSPVHHVTSVVSARAQGMFLYAKLVLWNLHEQTSRAEFEREMSPDKVPVGLDEAYARVAARLLGPTVSLSRQNSVRRLLGWLACAKRPLRWHEIQAAVVVDLDEGSYSAKLRFTEDCKDLCASLVDVSPDQTVTLVHSTTREFLVRRCFVSEPEAHYDLAKICILYLNMPELEPSRPLDDMKSACLAGFHAFLEYAACFWAFHVELAFKNLSQDQEDRIEVLAECFETFLDVQWTATGKPEIPSQKLKGHLAHLKARGWFVKACEAVATAKSWQRPLAKAPGDDCVLQLPSIVTQLRSVFEGILSSKSLDDCDLLMIDKYYGSRHYKCSRLNCQSFHQGFVTKLQREQHVAKHDRSFTCTWEGCPYEIFGFATSDGLRKHNIEQHGVITETSALEFPDEQAQPSEIDDEAPRRFECSTCQRTFSRAYNLQSHLRTHNKSRPFKCSSCEKDFPRKSDAVRHEKTHSGEKNFICGGVLNLETGERWGCGKSYGRADHLALHLQSDTGRACLAPVRAQSAAARVLLQKFEGEENTSADGTQLSSRQLVENLLLPPLKELPSPILSDNPILPDLQWEGYESIVWNQWATKLSQDERVDASHSSSDIREIGRDEAFTPPRLRSASPARSTRHT